MKVRFTKMHGLGNDFVVVDGRGDPDRPWSAWAKRFLDRRMGVGGDQFLVILPSQLADFRMATFERNGKESEICGNGIRCVAKYVHEADPRKRDYQVETKGGMKSVSLSSPDRIRVDMGKPVFGAVWGLEREYSGRRVTLFPLSMGNPHAVVFVDKPEQLSWVSSLGPLIETDEPFPEGTNVEFVHVKSRKSLLVRVWERNAGETLACGTGACAAAAAAVRERKAESPVKVQFQEGALEVSWTGEEAVTLSGPATEVFRGEIEL